MQFFTATINSWQNLLASDNLKNIVLSSMDWVVANKKAAIHAFVIMPNHVHFLWTNLDEDYDLAGRFKSFTGSQFREYLIKHDLAALQKFQSTQNDREFHFWERRSMSKNVLNKDVAFQKINYIHTNPLQEKWKLVAQEEDYYYSSAAFYLKDEKHFSFLSRYEDWI